MMRCLKLEFWKLFHNALFWVALIIGALVSSIDIAENAMRVFSAGTEPELIHRGYAGINLFVRWICVNTYTAGYVWFFFIFPLIASIAYGWSFVSERESGYIKNIVSRTNKANYYVPKYIVTYCGGGMAVAIPLLLNLLLNALVCPAETPSILTMAAPIAQGSFMSILYYTHPWAYSLIAVFTDFLWGGAIASLCYCFGFFLRKGITVVVLPFVLFVGMDFSVSILGVGGSTRYELSPLALIHATTLNSNPAWLVFSVIAGIICIAITASIYKGYHDEHF